MSLILVACCYLYVASACVALGKKRTRHHGRILTARTSKRKRSYEADDEDDQKSTRSEPKSVDIDIAEMGYKRKEQIHQANESAFYQRASRLTCVSKTSFTDLQCLAESTCQDAKFNGHNANQGSCCWLPWEMLANGLRIVNAIFIACKHRCATMTTSTLTSPTLK